jgi:hypothetical protein
MGSILVAVASLLYPPLLKIQPGICQMNTGYNAPPISGPNTMVFSAPYAKIGKQHRSALANYLEASAVCIYELPHLTGGHVLPFILCPLSLYYRIPGTPRI